MPEPRINQATQTIGNGLAWDSIKGLVTHFISSSGKTVCGKDVSGGASYGWYPSKKDEKTKICPDCAKRKTVPVAQLDRAEIPIRGYGTVA